jgi:hypothetical protein
VRFLRFNIASLIANVFFSTWKGIKQKLHLTTVCTCMKIRMCLFVLSTLLHILWPNSTCGRGPTWGWFRHFKTTKYPERILETPCLLLEYNLF